MELEIDIKNDLARQVYYFFIFAKYNFRYFFIMVSPNKIGEEGNT